MASTAILILGDTLRTPELRHEVPLGIPDPFVYAEVDGRRHRRDQLDGGDARRGARHRARGAADSRSSAPTSSAGAGSTSTRLRDELAVRIVARARRSSSAIVPPGFPLGIADALRASGDRADRRPEALRRPAAARRARTSSPGSGAPRRRPRRASRPRASSCAGAERANGGLALDGEPLTCELLKERDPGGVPRARRARRRDDRLARPADRGRPRHGLRRRSAATTSSCSISSRVDLESACFADMTRTFVVGDVAGRDPRVARALPRGARARGRRRCGRA